MKILITGCNGLLGQKLVHSLNLNQYDLFGFDLGDLLIGDDNACTYSRVDLTEKVSTIENILKIKPDVIIHAAAMTAVDLCETEKEICWKTNVSATDHIVYAASKIGSRVVFISTDYIFDGKNGPYDEEDVPNPICYYGKSKLAAENIVRGSQTSWTIVRTNVLYGTGKNINSSFTTWLINELHNKRHVKIVHDQWGNMTLVEDLVAGIKRIVQFDKTGIYNVGGSEFLTRFEFANKIAELYGFDQSLIIPVSTDEFDFPAPRPLKSGLKIQKAEKDLFISFHNVEESLNIYRLHDS